MVLREQVETRAFHTHQRLGQKVDCLITRCFQYLCRTAALNQIINKQLTRETNPFHPNRNARQAKAPYTTSPDEISAINITTPIGNQPITPPTPTPNLPPAPLLHNITGLPNCVVWSTLHTV